MNSDSLNIIKLEIIELFEEALAGHGQNKRVGSIYANLIASPKALTQDQLAEKLQTSNSTVSRSLNSLEERFRLIKSKRLPGTKKAEYRPSKNTFDTFFTLGILELYQQYQRFLNRVESIKTKYQGLVEGKRLTNDLKFYDDLVQELYSSINFHNNEIKKLVDVLRNKNN